MRELHAVILIALVAAAGVLALACTEADKRLEFIHERAAALETAHSQLTSDLCQYARARGEADGKQKRSHHLNPFVHKAIRRAWFRGWLLANGIDGVELERLVSTEMAGFEEKKR